MCGYFLAILGEISQFLIPSSGHTAHRFTNCYIFLVNLWNFANRHAQWIYGPTKVFIASFPAVTASRLWSSGPWGPRGQWGVRPDRSRCFCWLPLPVRLWNKQYHRHLKRHNEPTIVREELGSYLQPYSIDKIDP